MEKKIGAVVVAAGYGSLREVAGSPHSKLLEYVQGVPMIARILQAIVVAEIEPITVVVNPVFGPKIKECLDFYRFSGVQYAVQPERRGAADAVHRALPILRAKRSTDALITFGDMPLWQPRTIRALTDLHSKEEPTMTMISVRRKENSPAIFERYGRIVENGCGIRCAIEPAVANEQVLALPLVNPCLWVWDIAFLERHIPYIEPRVRNDGMPPEYDLPPLIEKAAREGRRIVHEELLDHREAVGVNTLEELEFIQTI